MPLPSLIGYGTQGYPEHVARRLRVFNVTAWCGSLMVFGFAPSDLYFPRRCTNRMDTLPKAQR